MSACANSVADLPRSYGCLCMQNASLDGRALPGGPPTSPPLQPSTSRPGCRCATKQRSTGGLQSASSASISTARRAASADARSCGSGIGGASCRGRSKPARLASGGRLPLDAPATMTGEGKRPVPEDHHITIDGKRWLLRFTKLTGEAAGWTFFDGAAKPRILIDSRERGWSRVETILHELLHASLGPNISEEAVTEAARVQRRVLSMLYTMVPKE